MTSKIDLDRGGVWKTRFSFPHFVLSATTLDRSRSKHASNTVRILDFQHFNKH